MAHEEYDIIIVGAGPAGCTCAYQLAKSGLKVALIEKEIFPRDKTCGDALSADVINQLNRIDPELLHKFHDGVIRTASHGIRMFSPNDKCLDIPLTGSHTSGFIAKRIDFDNFYFNQVKQRSGIDIYCDHKVEDIGAVEEGIIVKTGQREFSAKMVVGADGANSVVIRKLTNYKAEKDHVSAGVRQYFKNVSGFHEGGYIELHFYEGILPGYFWIFPLPHNQANVGLAMLSSEISKHKINLKEKLTEIIRHHPNVAERFKEATPMESIKGFGLPLGSKKRICSGSRFLLLGDAAGLIDPFSGEGISNAIRSGRIAAEHLIKTFEQKRFDRDFQRLYDEEIYAKMGKELRISHSMQRLLKYPKLVNLVFNKAVKNESLRSLIASMLGNADLKKKLLNPFFYLKLLFR